MSLRFFRLRDCEKMSRPRGHGVAGSARAPYRHGGKLGSYPIDVKPLCGIPCNIGLKFGFHETSQTRISEKEYFGRCGVRAAHALPPLRKQGRSRTERFSNIKAACLGGSRTFNHRSQSPVDVVDAFFYTSPDGLERLGGRVPALPAGSSSSPTSLAIRRHRPKSTRRCSRGAFAIS
jgi:hypothetical protein